MTSGFSELAMNLLRDRRSNRKIAAPTHIGYAGDEGAGDYVVMEFKVSEGTIKEIGYRCNGCPTSMACCELLGRFLAGRNCAAIREITPDILTKLLGEPAEGKEGIPAFVLGSLHDAFKSDFFIREQTL
ncbi:MAG: iron-sulfur cluster assembly scaffold protein [Fimbriimonadaceae bacterium]|nr:MAG: iron-sulfur cluster assembly scaffold protein [Fimbriimonadaceae bacterium]